MNLKLIILLLVGVICTPFCSISAQELVIQQFTASASGSDVMLVWELKPGTQDVSEYKIERKVNQEPVFIQIYTTSHNSGKTRYEFWDRTIFKDTPKQIHYKLTVMKNGQALSYDTYITVNPTSAQRTWGSIKSMFK